MFDYPLAIDEKYAVRNCLQQRGIFLLAESQVDYRACTAQHITNPVRQQGPIDGLDDKIRGADIVGLIDRHGIVTSGHHDDGQIRAAGKRADIDACLIAVAVGHIDIKQRNVGQAQCAGGDCRVTAGHGLYGESRLAQLCAGYFPHGRVVVGDQHSDGRCQCTHAVLRISSCSWFRTKVCRVRICA